MTSKDISGITVSARSYTTPGDMISVSQNKSLIQHPQDAKSESLKPANHKRINGF